jgi:hypothetical protein
MGLVVVDVPDDFVRVCLTPVTGSAGRVCDTAQVSAVEVSSWGLLVSIHTDTSKIGGQTLSLHVPICTPSVGINGMHSTRNGL